jgi:putative SOS response-associated peptidase YedK
LVVEQAPADSQTGRATFPIAVGLSARPVQGCAGHQFPFGGSPIPVGRCLIPASHFFEFKGTKSRKAKWKFTKTGEDWFCFAGIWRPMSAGGKAFTLLTTDPSPDVGPIHDRQMVVLERADWSAWLEQTGNEADLLRGLPPGSLKVEQVL